MRYANYFRETVTKRCHLAITDVPNARAAIAAARLTYSRTTAERCLNVDSVTGDSEIFAVDEFVGHDDTTPLRSWELDGISSCVGEPIDIEL